MCGAQFLPIMIYKSKHSLVQTYLTATIVRRYKKGWNEVINVRTAQCAWWLNKGTRKMSGWGSGKQNIVLAWIRGHCLIQLIYNIICYKQAEAEVVPSSSLVEVKVAVEVWGWGWGWGVWSLDEVL